MIDLAMLTDLPDAAAGWSDLIAPIGGLAFAALLVRLAMGQADKRATVAETREEKCTTQRDLVLEDNRAQAATIKDQTVTLLKVAGLAESAVTLATATSEKIDRIQALLERTGNARQRS